MKAVDVPLLEPHLHLLGTYLQRTGNMRLATLLPLLLAPLGALAAPAATPIDLAVRYSLDSRQARPPKPEPCERMTPAPNATETKARFDKFANAFIYTKNITEAFSYITKEYIARPSLSSEYDERPLTSDRITTPRHKTASTLLGTSSRPSGVRKTSRRCGRRSMARVTWDG